MVHRRAPPIYNSSLTIIIPRALRQQQSLRRCDALYRRAYMKLSLDTSWSLSSRFISEPLAAALIRAPGIMPAVIETRAASPAVELALRTWCVGIESWA